MWNKQGYNLIIERWVGRFGNNVLQLCCGIFIAEKTKSHLRFPSNNCYFTKTEYNFKTKTGNNCNITMKNKFFGTEILQGLDFNENEQRRVSLTYIRPILKYVLPHTSPVSPVSSVSPDKTLVIHIRSGDSMKPGVNKNYPQPPLAAYTYIVKTFKSIRIETTSVSALIMPHILIPINLK